MPIALQIIPLLFAYKLNQEICANFKDHTVNYFVQYLQEQPKNC